MFFFYFLLVTDGEVLFWPKCLAGLVYLNLNMKMLFNVGSNSWNFILFKNTLKAWLLQSQYSVIIANIQDPITSHIWIHIVYLSSSKILVLSASRKILDPFTERNNNNNNNKNNSNNSDN